MNVPVTLKNSLLRWALFCAFALIALPGTARLQTVDRSKPPALGPPASLKLPAIEHRKLSNGMAVHIMEKHDLPLVEIELVVMAGSACDPPGKTGIASLTSAVLEEGAGSRNSLELADAIDYLGASIGPFSGNHTSGVSLHTPLSKLDSALALFTDMALRPRFPADELERRRKELLTGLIQAHDDPPTIAAVAFRKELFGLDHPYGRSSVGTEQTLRSFAAEDARHFYDTWYHPDNAFFVVVGDVTPDVITKKLDAYFGGWKSTETQKLTWPAARQVESKKIYLVDKPGAAQSVIRIGRIGAERTTPDYYALVVLNTILGGSFTSRLNQNLREQHGYAYGAGSIFDFRKLPGPFAAVGSVQTDVTDKALAEFMKELTNIMAPVTDQELDRAKNYLALGYPQNFQSISGMAGQLAELVIFNLPDSYFNDYTKHILGVTKDDVEQAAKKYLDPERVKIIIVGDRQKIEPGITALKLAPLENLTIDDVLGKAPVLDDKK